MHSVLLLHNIEKNTNLGQMIRTANAFGVLEICIVGKKKYSSYGNKKTHSSTAIRHFFKFEQAAEYYQQQGFNLAAVEISAQAVNVNTHSFTGNTVFVMGNEGIGLSAATQARCDYSLYIPQYGAGASINVNVASGIVLNAFCAAHSRTSNTINQHKFINIESD